MCDLLEETVYCVLDYLEGCEDFIRDHLRSEANSRDRQGIDITQ